MRRRHGKWRRDLWGSVFTSSNWTDAPRRQTEYLLFGQTWRRRYQFTLCCVRWLKVQLAHVYTLKWWCLACRGRPADFFGMFWWWSSLLLKKDLFFPSFFLLIFWCASLGLAHLGRHHVAAGVTKCTMIVIVFTTVQQ